MGEDGRWFPLASSRRDEQVKSTEESTSRTRHWGHPFITSYHASLVSRRHEAGPQGSTRGGRDEAGPLCVSLHACAGWVCVGDHVCVGGDGGWCVYAWCGGGGTGVLPILLLLHWRS